MADIRLNNEIDCAHLSSDEINYQVKNLIFNKLKKIVLKNTFHKEGLLHRLKGNLKIEICGDVSNNFANSVNGLKIIVNGNVGENSANSAENSKFTVFGSSSAFFGNDSKASEFYILENCAKSSFCNLDANSRAVIGGQAISGFASDNNGGTVLLLNLKGGNVFIDDDWFKDFKSGLIYIRSDKDKIKAARSDIKIVSTAQDDEDIYLPLISEFARLFNYSLNEIKSLPFYRLQ